MPSKLSRSLLIFALLVVAVVSWQWIDERGPETTLASDPLEMAQTQSDYYLENFEITNISNKTNVALENNTPENTIETRAGMPADRQLTIAGKSLSHHYIDGNSTINSPIVKLRSADNGQWSARASSGVVSANFDVLDLQGEVRLTHKRTSNDKPVTVNTNAITINTTDKTISSHEPVQVEGEGWRYNASSMNAEIDQGILSFTSGVEAQFESPDKR